MAGGPPGRTLPGGGGGGADPATILGAVTPVPDSLSEYCLCRSAGGSRTEVVKALSCDLEVPASAEIVLVPYIWSRGDGPEGLTAITLATTTKWTSSGLHHHPHDHARDAIYHSTYTGRPAR